MRIEEQFNKIAADYDAKRRMFIPCFDAFYSETTEFLTRRARPPKIAADLGAGTGLLSYFWRKNVPEAQYLLMDAAQGMLDIARRRFAGLENMRFEAGDYTDHLPEINFDTAISALSMHHLDDREKFRLFRALYERLPENGLFVNYDQFRASSPAMDAWYSAHWEAGLMKSGLSAEDLALWRERRKLDKECSAQEEIRMLLDSGFRSVELVFSFQKFAVIAAIKQAAQ